MYSIYGSGHYHSRAQGYNMASSCTVQHVSYPIKKRPCPTEPFNLKEWILAAGVIFFFSPSLISRTLTICFCKATVHLTTMAFHLSQGWKVNKG